RAVTSMPLREKSRTERRFTSAMSRKPSHLVSYTHSLLSNGSSTSVASIGRYSFFMLFLSDRTQLSDRVPANTDNARHPPARGANPQRRKLMPPIQRITIPSTLAHCDKPDRRSARNDHGKHEEGWPRVSFDARDPPVAGHSVRSCRRHRIFLEPDAIRARPGSDFHCMCARARWFFLRPETRTCPFHHMPCDHVHDGKHRRRHGIPLWALPFCNRRRSSAHRQHSDHRRPLVVRRRVLFVGGRINPA